MSDAISTADVSIDDATITVQSGLHDTDDGIFLKVAGDAYPRIHLTPQGTILQGDGTVAPEVQASGGGGITSVTKTTQQDATSTTTLADITGFSFDVTNGQPMEFDSILAIDGNTSGDMKFAMTGPAGYVLAHTLGVSNSASSTGGGYRHYNTISAFASEVTAIGTVTGATQFLRITGSVVPTADGTVQFQFAQRSSNGDPTSILVGSRLAYWESTGVT